MYTKENQSFLLENMRRSRQSGIVYQKLDPKHYSGRVISINGKELINFCNCSYLGLENDRRIIQGAQQAAEEHGVLLSSSRSFISSPLYEILEESMQDILPGYQVITSTTTLGHCATLPLVIERNDAIILDQYVHNSIKMASQLCKANGTNIVPVRHNNIQNIEVLYYRLKKQGAGKIWYCADGIYSMQGDLAPLNELNELLNKLDDLFIYIDDAHGFGWTGMNGAGYVMGNKQLHDKMIAAVSMCKSFAAYGGIICFPNKEWAEKVRMIGQTLVFSSPVSPPLLGAAIASAAIHTSKELPTLQQELKSKIHYFRRHCLQNGISISTNDETPIQTIETGTIPETTRILHSLIEKGMYVSGALYPAVPKHHNGIRVQITRHITFDDLDLIIENLALEIDKSKFDF